MSLSCPSILAGEGTDSRDTCGGFTYTLPFPIEGEGICWLATSINSITSAWQPFRAEEFGVGFPSTCARVYASRSYLHRSQNPLDN